MKKAERKEGEPLRPDLCVIGAGSAGLSVAAIAASLGVSVVLVEKGTMGGECLNTGCVPSKALLAAVRKTLANRNSSVKPNIDFAAVQRHVKEIVAATAPMDSRERYKALGAQVIEAEAKFTGTGTLLAAGQIIQARRFVIATGSRPAIPSIPGLDGIPFLTNETIFGLVEKPEHLMIVGGGAVGVELAQAFARLGSRVTLIEAGERLLATEDPELVTVIERALRRDGVVIETGRSIARLEAKEGEGLSLILEGSDEPVRGSHLLLAAGREAVLDGLRLDEAGVETDKTGIVVDRRLKTSNRRIYAIGDCAGGKAASARFTHTANHQAGLVIRSALFRLPTWIGRAPVPRVLYTDPELAAVGLTEAEARARHRSIRILRWSFADNDRARAERVTEGHVKAIVTPRGRILGCTIAGAPAGELIMPWVLAMSKGLKVSDLAGLVYPYPTFSEVTKSTAVEFLKPSAQNPWLRRLIGFLRRLG
jgi:pyruvate/2-oxoglutarate dehydrogenase complex dihydrolipoamide dehydrogenase (E3) component